MLFAADASGSSVRDADIAMILKNDRFIAKAAFEDGVQLKTYRSVLVNLSSPVVLRKLNLQQELKAEVANVAMSHHDGTTFQKIQILCV